MIIKDLGNDWKIETMIGNMGLELSLWGKTMATIKREYIGSDRMGIETSWRCPSEHIEALVSCWRERQKEALCTEARELLEKKP